MVNRIKVSASIVTYNNPLEEVFDAAQSFLSTDLSTILTIVDNCSDGDYFKRLQEKIGAIENIRFIQSGINKGYGFGHNIGIKNAPACEYYLVLNPDILIHEGTLEKLIDFMDSHLDVGVIGPKILNPDGSCQYLNLRRTTVLDLFLRRFLPKRIQKIKIIQQRMDYYIMKDKGYDKVQDIPHISGCCMLLRKSLLDEIGGFDENFFMYLEDTDLTIRMGKKARNVFFPDVAVTHHWSRGAYYDFRLTWIAIKSAFYLFSKWGWRWI